MKQIEMKIKEWGGKRAGAGRKNRSGQVSHGKREKVLQRYPLHITLKRRKGLSSLRGHKLYQEFRICVAKAKRKGLRVIEYSVLSDHVHLFCEADDNQTLESGMKSLLGRYGKKIRLKSGGKGPAFHGRYHMRVVKSVRQCRNTIKYVLFNHSKHIGDHVHPDELSSSYSFAAWHELLGGHKTAAFEPRPNFLSPAKSWLARAGWKLAG